MESNVFYYQAKLEKEFSEFLSEKRSSKKTIKNYLTDLRNFLTWIAKSIWVETTEPQNIQDFVTSISKETITAYVKSQSVSHTPEATINRRLSALRIFWTYLTAHNYTRSTPFTDIANVLPHSKKAVSKISILGAFEQALQQEGAAITTVRHYTNDVEQFLIWFEVNYKTSG